MTSQFRIITFQNSHLNDQMIKSHVSDTMVIEVYVNNKQATESEVKELLMERWQLQWHRRETTGVEAWTGWMNSAEKTANLMMRRVALSSRMTQVMGLLKRASTSQYEVCYRISQTASTLYFGPTDETATIIFHGHAGHRWWHINSQASLSFTLTYRRNPWVPRSLPTHISGAAIFDDYIHTSATASSYTDSAAASPLSPPPTGHYMPSSSVPNPTITSRTHAPGAVHASPHQAPLYASNTPPNLSHHQQPYYSQYPRQQNQQPPTGATRFPSTSPPTRQPPTTAEPSSSNSPYASSDVGDDYAALPPQSRGPPIQPAQQSPSSAGMAASPPPFSSSLPKQSYWGNTANVDGNAATGTMAGQTGTSHLSFGPSSPRTPFPTTTANAATLATSPTGGSNIRNDFKTGAPAVPGSSPTSDVSPRPVRVRSSSSSMSQLLGSTSISPYRVDLNTTMGKSPPTHQLPLPMDMIGGPSSRPSSAARLPTPSPSTPIPSATAAAANTTTTAGHTPTIRTITTSTSPWTHSAHGDFPNHATSPSSSSYISDAHKYYDLALEYDYTNVLGTHGALLPPTAREETPLIARLPTLSHDHAPPQYVFNLYREILSFTVPQSTQQTGQK